MSLLCECINLYHEEQEAQEVVLCTMGGELMGQSGDKSFLGMVVMQNVNDFLQIPLSLYEVSK